MIDFSKYISLSVSAQQVLCFMAHMGVNYYVSSSYKAGYLAKLASKMKFDIKEVYVELEKAKLIKKFSSTWQRGIYDYDIERAEIIAVLLFLYKERSEWVSVFDYYRPEASVDFITVRKSVQQFVKGKHISPLSYAWNMDVLTTLYVPYLGERELLPLFDALDFGIFRRVVSMALISSFKNDTPLDFDSMMYVVNKHSRLTYAERNDLICDLTLYRYFYDGTYEPSFPASHKHYIAYLLKAVRLMNMGEYAKALPIFLESLKMRNKLANEKNVYSNSLANYYLLMAYYFEGTLQSKTKLIQFAKKRSRLEQMDQLWTPLLAGLLADETDEFYRNAMNILCRHDVLSINDRNLIDMLVEFWECGNPSSSTPKKPLYKIIRHELSHILDLTVEEKAELAELYGNKPLVSSVCRKAYWETVLDNLDSIVDNGEQVKDAEREERLVYVVNQPHCVEVREQRKLKNGAWSAGKKVGRSNYDYGDMLCMDDVDRRIWNTYKQSCEYDLDITHVLPNMIGVPRVFTGYYAPLLPVDVQGEQAYLEITKGKKGFKVSSNLTTQELRSLDSGCVIRKIDEQNYTVVEIEPRNVPYYLQLMGLGTIPLEAESKLRTLLPKLGKFVEIHSDMLEGGASVEIVKGAASICVLVENVSADVFMINLRVRPLKDGNKLVLPGVGASLLLDEKDGKTFRVKRDIREERENCVLLCDFIESIVGEELGGGESVNVVLDTWGMLVLMDFVSCNSDTCYIEWERGNGLKLKRAVNPAEWNVQMKSRAGWFEVEGDVMLDDDTLMSVAQLIQLLGASKSKRFVQLNGDEFVLLTDSLRKQLTRLESVASADRTGLRISPLNAALLNNEAFEGEFTITRDKKLEELRKKIEESKTKQIALPKNLKATLRDYQMDGYHWMARLDSWGAGVCLADDMGLGKTVQTIVFLLHKSKQGPSLVISPVSVIPNWRKELERFAPSLSVAVINGADDRSEKISKASAGNIVLASYGMLLTNNESFVEKDWNVVVLDEAHAIKNRDTKTSAVIMKLHCGSRVVLTGTPIQNNLGELWNLFQFANPGLLGNWEDFKRKYVVPIEEGKDKERQKQLKRIIQPFMLRRTKSDVLDDLPEKNEIVVPVELSEEELAVYELIRRRAENYLKEGGNRIEVQALAEITRLRQAACSAELVEKKWCGANSKVDAFVDIAVNISVGGNRALVFSQFTSFLDIVRKRLDEAGIQYLYLDGSTPVKQRERLVEEFQQGECPLFLISLKAGGLGLNLVGANYVVHLDPWWNPAIEQQATDRAYRIGQQQNVTVYHLITKNTIEEKILRLHKTKQNMADALLEGADMSHKLTSSDLLEMINSVSE